jgi:hypothetical protein
MARNYDTTQGVYWRIGPITIDPKEDGSVYVEYTEREAAVVEGRIRYLDGQPLKRFFSMTAQEVQTATAPFVDPTTGNTLQGNATAIGLYAHILAFIRQNQKTVSE